MSITPVDVLNTHFQVTLSVSPLISRLYRTPGQVIQLLRYPPSRPFLRAQPQVMLFTLASPPQAQALDVLVHVKNDPLRLCKSSPGDVVYVSRIGGGGLDWLAMMEKGGDFCLFADTISGMALVRALVEWEQFRRRSGEGANRKIRVKVYYGGGAGMHDKPWTANFTDWSVYGVQVWKKGAKCQVQKGEWVVGCVNANKEWETLFEFLLNGGARRERIIKYTDEDMEKCLEEHIEVEDVEDYAQAWDAWTVLREEMRMEFETMWTVKARVSKDTERNEKEKRQAWEKWCMKNKDKWDKIKWDNEQWSQYWSSWAKDSGSAKDRGRNANTNNWTNGNQWSQTKSQEYWDWVGKGAGAGKRKETTGQKWNPGYGGGNQWKKGAKWDGDTKNSWSGYQRKGYRYDYEEGGDKGNGQGWRGWNRDSSSKRKSWGSSSGSSRDLQRDFYKVLGIEAGASKADIKKAYRKKAMQHHPDRNPGRSEEAHKKMKEIVVAWSVLKDEAKRRRYDANGTV